MAAPAPRRVALRRAGRATALLAAAGAAGLACSQAQTLSQPAHAPGLLPFGFVSRQCTDQRGGLALRRAAARSELTDYLLGGAPERRTDVPSGSAQGARTVADAAEGSGRPKVVFLGSPECVCVVLKALHDGASTGPVPFDLCAVVSQPPKRVKNKKEAKTPVHELAEALGVDRIWTPGTAKDESFLEALEELAPDVCITAAYGQYLPKRFLRTPKLGTLNLHPSLLPRWRGASPVQRSLEAGDTETGITILYTVTKMDAGPLVVQETTTLEGLETSEQMLDKLFTRGSELLLENALPRVFRGEVDMGSAQQQDEGMVTKAPLIRKEEGKLWPHNETAAQMLNKVRAFTPWPGTTLPVACSGSKAPLQGVRVIVSDVEVISAAELPAAADGADRCLQELVLVPAEDGKEAAVAVRPANDPDNALLMRTMQLPAKKKVSAFDFSRGYMKTQPARWMTPEEESKLTAGARPGGSYRKQKRVRPRR